MEVVRRETKTHTEEVPNKLEDFKDWRFSSGTTTGKDFDRFSRIYKKFIKNNLPVGVKLVKYNKGHYILSGFIEKNSNFVYFSVSDVRHFKNKWAENILIRTAENQEDFTGDTNSYTTLENFEEDIKELLSK